MGVFSIDTEMFHECNGFPTHITDRVQLFERFNNRVRRICKPTQVYSNDVDRTSVFYHLYYEDLIGDLRGGIPQKNIRDPFVQWTDSVYSVLDDEFSGISQMPFFETHHVQELQLRRGGEEEPHLLSSSSSSSSSSPSHAVKVMRYVVKPTPILSFYNDFPQSFASEPTRLERMKEYYDFMTELMNYVVLRFKQSYHIRATVNQTVRHSNHKNDEVIRVYLTEDDVDDTMSMLYGFRAIIQVIEEAKRWVEDFYKCVVERGELSRFEFVSSILENITLYMVPIAHPTYPNEVQISIANYTYLYKDTVGREKKMELRRQMYHKWTTALFELQESIGDAEIPTMSGMPIFYVPSLQLHTPEYMEQLADEEDQMEITYAQPVEVIEARDETRHIRVGTIIASAASESGSSASDIASTGTINLDEIKSSRQPTHSHGVVKHIRISTVANPLRESQLDEMIGGDGDDGYGGDGGDDGDEEM
jgi:hypothetical protein